MTLFSEILHSVAHKYPRIPVTRKWRLPWILVQLMKLSMLLESTVCLCSAPVPSHTARVETNTISCDKWKITLVFCVCFQPFGQSPLQSSHCLWPSLSTSILSGGQALTQELSSTTKWATRRDKQQLCHQFTPYRVMWQRLCKGIKMCCILCKLDVKHSHSLGHWETQMDPYWYFALGLVSIWNVCLL